MKTRISEFLAAAVATMALGAVVTDAVADGPPGGDSNGRWGDEEHGQRGSGQGPKACANGQELLDRNTETVIAYYTTAFNDGLPEEAVERYVGVDENGDKLYIQHNPLAADGPQAFIDFVNLFKGIFPDMNINIVRTIAQCDMVMTHGHLTLFEGDLGSAAADIFRLDETGRIVEHWDVVQEVPAESANDNGMF
jgi:predicted SnoaL-like aldol condensation-catalyzing enzyme